MNAPPEKGGDRRDEEWLQGDKALFHFLRFAWPRAKNFSLITFLIALAGGAGGAWLENSGSPKIDGAVRTAATMIGFIVGAVIGGLAMMTRAIDTQLLRKLRSVNAVTPLAKFFSPFLHVILLGVASGVLLLVVAGLSDCAPVEWKTGLGGAAGFFTIWALVELLPVIGSLLYFMDMLEAAARKADIKLDEER
ncbi:hypothetical protein [Streptomyces canus]|uniref:hypothetical protein n=1 Tax=Streptomyces canus TaxID=58343 RepID=UPI0030DEF3C8